MAVIHLTKQNYDEIVQQSEKPVLIDFWAVWCTPCTMFSPIVDQAAAELEGRAVVAKVNIDEEPGLAEKFGVMHIPTMVAMRGGQEVSRHMGPQPLQDVIAMVQ